jgi:wyosine [tRNA(Phe)-imidazoG37] synthetase (radical SAM superfamily)
MGAPRADSPRKVVYGPVPSWRLGRSLGIDLISRPKTCSFDCIYCQLGATRERMTRRHEFVPTSRLVAELDALPDLEVDVVTFSGLGEPTLATNLGEAIVAVGDRLRSPVAVLTNSSLMPDPVVRAELCLADVVVAKVDAPDEDLLRKINRPANGISLEAILEGLKQFREDYCGRLAIQVMFCAQNSDHAVRIAGRIAALRPDEVQLNTPLRPSPTPPLGPKEMAAIRDAFRGLPVVSVYEARKRSVRALDAHETEARRPDKNGKPPLPQSQETNRR